MTRLTADQQQPEHQRDRRGAHDDLHRPTLSGLAEREDQRGEGDHVEERRNRVEVVFAALGVRRVSLGSGTQRVVLGTLKRFARRIRDEGTLTPLATDAVPYAEIQKLLSRA